jgi:YesN/AraC family two-component response regulator
VAAALAAAERKLPAPGDGALSPLFAARCGASVAAAAPGHGGASGRAEGGPGLEEAFRTALGELAKRKRHVAERPRSRQVAEAMAYLNANFAKPVSLEGLAEIVDARPSALSRLFQAETGKSFMEYLITLRIDFAKRELAAGGKSIKEIATASGYPDANYFSRLFKKETGFTPSEFTQQGGKEP